MSGVVLEPPATTVLPYFTLPLGDGRPRERGWGYPRRGKKGKWVMGGGKKIVRGWRLRRREKGG